MVRSLFEQSRKREEKETRYIKSAEAYVEVLLDYAYKRKISEFSSRDKQAVGKSLREALDQVNAGKPLTSEQTKLISAFRDAMAQETEKP